MKLLYRAVVGILVIVVSLVLLMAAGCNCQSQDATSSQATTQTSGKSFIWKISSETTHVYLLGSVHVASQDIYPFDDTIEDAFNSANYLVVEINTNNLTQAYAIQLLLDYGTYPQGDGFKKHVSEDLYNKLDEQFKQYGMSMALLDGYKPFVIYNLMSLNILSDLGYKIEYGIDLYFMNKAKESNKDILELETVEFQYQLLSSVPDEEMIMAMQYDIDNPETVKYLQDLLDAWTDGDVAKMETITFEALTDEPDMASYYEMMFDQRNLGMAEKIKDFLGNDEVYFIVVGAGHLVGENGLINLLQNAGYELEQLDKSGD
jgi:uncharacterized protein YbaP (TraB family)